MNKPFYNGLNLVQKAENCIISLTEL